MSAEPSDADRYPTLSDRGRAMLRHMREHPAAPLFRNASGNRLQAAEVAALHDYERDIGQARFEWQPGVQPPWLDAFVANTFAHVPHYRAQSMPARFDAIASVPRRCGVTLNSAFRSGSCEPPCPVALGSPVCAIKPSITRWNLIPS